MAAVFPIVVGLALIGQFHAVLGECLDGFEHHGMECYKAASLEASWIEAKHYCRLLGAELAVVETQAEEKLIEGILQRIHRSHIDERFWISGSDMITEGQWRWFTADGYNSPINYTNWGAGRPDNAGGLENCLAIVYAGTRTWWNDETCNNLHSFICEHRSATANQGP